MSYSFFTGNVWKDSLDTETQRGRRGSRGLVADVLTVLFRLLANTPPPDPTMPSAQCQGSKYGMRPYSGLPGTDTDALNSSATPRHSPHLQHLPNTEDHAASGLYKIILRKGKGTHYVYKRFLHNSLEKTTNSVTESSQWQPGVRRKGVCHYKGHKDSGRKQWLWCWPQLTPGMSIVNAEKWKVLQSHTACSVYILPSGVWSERHISVSSCINWPRAPS